MKAETLQARIEMSVKALKTHKFDSLAFSGMSGAFIGPPVAMTMHKSMLLVRKKDDTTHGDYRVEGDVTVKSYVIIDDFICSGNTRQFVIDSIEEFAPRAKCLGLLSVNRLSKDVLKEHRGKKFPLD